MTTVKVASSTRVTDRLSFHEWLDDLPFHTPITRRLDLWAEAMSSSIAIWVFDKEGGDEFFFY